MQAPLSGQHSLTKIPHAGPWIFHGTPWNSMEHHGFGTTDYGILWFFHGNPGFFHRKPFFPWTLIGFYGTKIDDLGINFQALDVGLPTGGIIWEVEGRGSGSKGVECHTNSPTQVEGLLSLYDMLPPYYHSPDLPPPK